MDLIETGKKIARIQQIIREKDMNNVQHIFEDCTGYMFLLKVSVTKKAVQ
jgi:hypothetical protein